MMFLKFFKMHGAGNDFVVLDAFAQPSLVTSINNFSQLSRRLCVRHFGIGSDGLLLLMPSQNADARMRMWNPDGTEDMCGNGLRCVSWLFHQRGYSYKSTFTVETIAGVHAATMLSDQTMRVQMGMAQWNLDAIPMDPPESTFAGDAIEYKLPIESTFIPHVTSLFTGTTHTVIFVEELPDDADFMRLNPLIENHPWFPKRTTALWVKVLSPKDVEVRIWERGAGETLACGTGACAIAAATWRTKRSAVPEITVRSKGGALRVSQNDRGELLLAGAVELVFEGEIENES